MKTNYYTETELKKIGFKSIGRNVLISRKCSIYDAKNICIGDHVRIDDFCILSGNITIKNYVHISAYTALYGRFGITIGNFCGISPRCTLFSATDDFSGEYMISPMVPKELIHLTTGPIILNDYCQIGVNSIVMPNITFKEGAVCGAFSFVNHSLPAWSINVGIPCCRLKERKKNPQELSKKIPSCA